MMDKAEVKKILLKNKDRNFVQRVLNPGIFPRIDNGDGSVSTHLMSAEVDEFGEWFVFPMIVQGADGKLRQMLNPQDAMSYAKKTGEYISFGKDADSAIEFSKDYKSAWDSK